MAPDSGIGPENIVGNAGYIAKPSETRNESDEKSLTKMTAL